MACGDLDGDTYLIIAEPEILKYVSNQSIYAPCEADIKSSANAS